MNRPAHGGTIQTRSSRKTEHRVSIKATHKEKIMSQALSLTPEDLQGMIAAAVTAAVAESKKPAPLTEAQLAEIEQAQQIRFETAQSAKQAEENKRATQARCTHEHPKREGSHSHCVWVREENPASPGYILCQLCQAKVRPEGVDRQDKQSIYNTALFNKLFQDCNDASMQ
jgi:hypothetical protein